MVCLEFGTDIYMIVFFGGEGTYLNAHILAKDPQE